MNWRKSVWLVLGATLLFPPAGLILLWLRQGTKWWKKVLASFPVLVFCLVYVMLGLFAGIQLNIIEPTGGMDGIMFTQSRYDQIPASREPVTVDATLVDEEFGAYWTQFRGPNRDGKYDQTPILTDWPEAGPLQLWKQPCGGGPRSTPTWDDGRVYVAGATGELWCLDAETGDVIWNKNIQENATNFYYGVSGSPLIVDDMLIVQPSGKEGASFIAFNKTNGEKIWSALEEKNEYASPVVVTLAGQRQIVSYTDKRYVGLNIEDGALLWDHPVQNPNAVHMVQPLLIDENRVFHSASYGTGCEMFSVTQDNGVFKAERLWKNNRMKNKFASSILHDGFIYGLDESIFSCMNPENGERVWKGGRYGYGQFLFASGHIVLITERGDLVLMKATPDGHQELARAPAIEGKTWNAPAMSDGFLLVRNAAEMACYDLRPAVE